MEDEWIEVLSARGGRSVEGESEGECESESEIKD